MSAVPPAIKAPVEPQVNLLPPEVMARRARGRRRGLIGLGFGLFIILMGVAVYLASARNSAAQTELQKEVDAGALLKGEIDSYQWVLDLQTELKGAQSAQTFVGSTEILWSDMVGRIANAIPPDAILESVVWTPGGVFGFPEPGTSPFDVADVGVVEFSGILATYVSGADLQEAIDSIPGLARARVTTETRNDDAGLVYYSFDGTARLTGLAFSGRFSPEWIVTDHRLDAGDQLNQKVEAAQAELDLANADLADGNPGASAAVQDATAALEAARADLDQYVAILGVVVGAETSVKDLEDALAAGEDGATEALATAQVKQDELRPVLAELVDAVRAWYEAATDEAVIETRIATAELLVANAETYRDLILEQVAGGDADADTLRDAESDLAYAQSTLEDEKEYLPAAQAATLEMRKAVDAALAAAAVVAPVSGPSEVGPSDDGGDS